MSFCIFFKIWFPKFTEMLLHFYVHCGFGIGLILVNTGLSWELHGPHTALHPEHVLASAHSPKQQVWEEGGTKREYWSPLGSGWTCQEAIHLLRAKAVKKFLIYNNKFDISWGYWVRYKREHVSREKSAMIYHLVISLGCQSSHFWLTKSK